MTIEVNKDVEKYTESFLLGLTLKQSIYSGLSLLAGCLIIFLLYERIGLTFSCYIAVPVVAPIALCGFYTYNNMSFPEILTRYLRNMLRNRWLLYYASEYPDEQEEYKKMNPKPIKPIKPIKPKRKRG